MISTSFGGELNYGFWYVAAQEQSENCRLSFHGFLSALLPHLFLLSQLLTPDTYLCPSRDSRAEECNRSLPFSFTRGSQRPYMPCRQNTFCAYCQYRYFHTIYGYINTKSANTHKLAQHKYIWNQERQGRTVDISVFVL